MPTEEKSKPRPIATTQQLSKSLPGKSRSFNSGFLGFSPTGKQNTFDQLQLQTATAISSPSKPSGSLISGSSPGQIEPHHVTTGQTLGTRKNSADDLAAQVISTPPVNSISDARILYRKWRTGPHGSGDLDSAGTSPSRYIAGIPTESDSEEVESSKTMNEVHVPDTLSRSPFEQPTYLRSSPNAHPSFLRPTEQGVPFLRSTPEQLPRISEKLENTPLFANAYDPDLRARLLSEQLKLQEENFDSPVGGDAPQTSGGSYEKKTARSASADLDVTMKKARSYQALADLEKKGYFPVAPKPSAAGFQRGLKDSVVNDMCRAVVKHMVGDVYVTTSSQHGVKKVLNHLYEPVLQSVQNHFRQLPARYALSVNADDVPMHMRLLAKHNRSPNEISINAQLMKDDNGDILPNVCEVVVVSTDRDNLLDAITRALTAMKGSIMDADVMTTHDGVTLDRFVVRGMFMSEERQKELQLRIVQNLSQPLNDNLDAKTSGAPATEDTESVNLAEKLGVLEMVDKNEVKPEWKLDISEIKLGAPVGSGRSGSTYSAYWRGTRVAAKVVDTSMQNGTIGEEVLNEFHREVAVVSKLRHPNIVLFLGAAVNPPRYCLVFEFMENGTLTDLIRSRKVPLDFFRIAKEVAMGMNYLHLCSIMHRDLKSGNVLIDSHGTTKISDFGLSCVLDMGSSADLTAETGTYRWMAPEVIRHEPYSNKADIYSYGVVLWEMIAKDQPFRGLTPIQAAFAVARQQMRPALPRTTPLKIGELVEHCWHHDPARRPEFSAILEALPLVQKSLKKRDFKNLGFALPS